MSNNSNKSASRKPKKDALKLAKALRANLLRRKNINKNTKPNCEASTNNEK
ncbi:MAG: hypothetical protein ACK5AV_00910 [Alphaproteobacteria bacterium]|jgi:hypothetical protein|nr:hypothetical protein [Candidatus Jidaibacter sp.]